MVFGVGDVLDSELQKSNYLDTVHMKVLRARICSAGIDWHRDHGIAATNICCTFRPSGSDSQFRR